MNYAKDEKLGNIMSQKKQFLLERIDDYRSKISLTEKNSPVMKDAKHK